ncbi:methyltransferase domain-containing protein [Colletotrichum sojae]|uniref:Methyltransferase domain-containing protein n=1 Tax=Colletotrichum sojae TaxID=2175907 RepID=A0A8H6IYQ2_9PEZI|nr:methyltransferase domain-containing protein [Colletotrichum sojae]
MSVSSSVYDYRTENGRTYHRYKDGSTRKAPISIHPTRATLILANHREPDLQHNIFLRTFDNRLGTAPPNNPGTRVGRVLDVGTGTGIWAIDFADKHPEAEVYGVDLSAVQSALIPSNVYFEVDDIEERWIFSRPFDYIHSRMMTGSIRDWPTYLRNCYDNLSPGGYLELNDIDAIPTSDARDFVDSLAC